MKKFLAILLVACMMFSVSALASETKLADMFTLFDFGDEAKLEEEYIDSLKNNWGCMYAFPELLQDSWVFTCVEIPEYTGNYMDEIPQIRIEKISNASYGALTLECGWNRYIPNGYDDAKQDWTFAEDATWVGRNQFFKLRFKNMTANDRISIYVASDAWQDISNVILEISTNDTEFNTYIVDMAENNVKYEGGGNRSEFLRRSIWTRPAKYNTEKLYMLIFGSFTRNEYASEDDVTYMNIELGATVEIDYIIFAPTAEMAAGYKSYHEEGKITDATTTTEETTTTVDQTTTTEAVVDETTTTEAVVDETTTTEAVVDETTTTTEAVADETTTTVEETTTTVFDGTTTTTANGGNAQKDGGFPVWIIIVIVVVIGGGVAAFFVFKK